MKTLLVPIDFSSATPLVLATAQQLALPLRAAIHLVHVKEARAGVPIYPATMSGFGASEIGGFAGVPLAVPSAALPYIVEPNETEEAQLAKWSAQITGGGCPVAVHQPVGAVVDEILRCADQLEAAIIVMGSHGHGAVYNLLVGSVTEGVIKRSTRPVLLVPCGVAGS